MADNAVETLLLPPADINTIMGTKNLVVPSGGTYSRALIMGTYTPPECANASVPGEASNYDAPQGGRSAIAGQAIREPTRPSAHNVLQFVATFPDSEAARTFFTQRVADWSTCNGKTVTERGNDGTTAKFRVGPTNIKEDIDYLTLTNPDSAAADGMVCQRAITSISNVVIDTRACAKDITTQAIDIARQIRQSVH